MVKRMDRIFRIMEMIIKRDAIAAVKMNQHTFNVLKSKVERVMNVTVNIICGVPIVIDDSLKDNRIALQTLEDKRYGNYFSYLITGDGQDDSQGNDRSD